MSNSSTSNKPNLSLTCSVLVLVAVVIVVIGPLFAGWSISSGMIAANKAGCQMIQSGLQQVNPLPQNAPKTAADCVAAVDASAFLFRLVGIGMAYIVDGFICAFGFGLYSITRRKNPTQPETPTPAPTH